MKKRIILLFFYVVLIQVNLSQVFLYGQVAQKSDLNKWELDDSSGISVWIAMKESRNQGLNFIVYMKPEDYSIKNLTKVCSFFSKKYPDSRYLFVEIMTSKNLVLDEVTAKQKGYWSSEELPEELKSREEENLPDDYTILYRSVYFKADHTNRFSFYNKKENRFVTINIR